jgi:hypothetical protein
MAHKKDRRQRHIPQRTCVGCREHSAKGDLLRLVRTPDGVFADPSGKMNGRGAYIHANKICLKKAMTGSLDKALRLALSEADCERLQTLNLSLADEREAAAELIE